MSKSQTPQPHLTPTGLGLHLDVLDFLEQSRFFFQSTYLHDSSLSQTLLWEKPSSLLCQSEIDRVLDGRCAGPHDLAGMTPQHVWELVMAWTIRSPVPIIDVTKCMSLIYAMKLPSFGERLIVFRSIIGHLEAASHVFGMISDLEFLSSHEDEKSNRDVLVGISTQWKMERAGDGSSLMLLPPYRIDEDVLGEALELCVMFHPFIFSEYAATYFVARHGLSRQDVGSDEELVFEEGECIEWMGKGDVGIPMEDQGEKGNGSGSRSGWSLGIVVNDPSRMGWFPIAYVERMDSGPIPLVASVARQKDKSKSLSPMKAVDGLRHSESEQLLLDEDIDVLRDEVRHRQTKSDRETKKMEGVIEHIYDDLQLIRSMVEHQHHQDQRQEYSETGSSSFKRMGSPSSSSKSRSRIESPKEGYISLEEDRYEKEKEALLGELEAHQRRIKFLESQCSHLRKEMEGVGSAKRIHVPEQFYQSRRRMSIQRPEREAPRRPLPPPLPSTLPSTSSRLAARRDFREHKDDRLDRMIDMFSSPARRTASPGFSESRSPWADDRPPRSGPMRRSMMQDSVRGISQLDERLTESLSSMYSRDERHSPSRARTRW
eukprot:TRINITY_DN2512_c2_g1_i4.p1 TRINITY_DN2512_c2_g1~~TRINITY_DN2512_c2_g1_i4.p1  ORF type:complete len:600 (+),score=167.15 TRINITY_DN2512_c2_g1_i4:2226-4025(+)